MSTPVRCRTVFHAVILATALTATLAVPPARAHSPCDPTDNDRAEASRVLAGLTREIDVMEATIVEALRLQTGQLSGYAAQSAKAVTGALDAQTKLQAQIAREVEETRAMRARRPTDSGCAAITGLAGLAAARQAAESAYGRAADAETGRIAGDRAAVPDAGAAAGNAARFESLTSTYCNGAARRGGCRALPGRGCAPRRRSQSRQPVRPAHLRERSGTAHGGRAVAQSRRRPWSTIRLRWPPPRPIRSAAASCLPAPPTPAPRWPATTSPMPALCAHRAPRSEPGPPRPRRDATRQRRSAAMSFWSCSPAAGSRTPAGSSICKR